MLGFVGGYHLHVKDQATDPDDEPKGKAGWSCLLRGASGQKQSFEKKTGTFRGTAIVFPNGYGGADETRTRDLRRDRPAF